MTYCVKETALMLVQALKEYGVTDVFASPGSRCAPLTVALVRDGEIRVHPVIDERSSAFIAMGFASVSRRPAMLLCTSGTALLNYSAAVAEAFYRNVPLLIVSADRPEEWIGQDDSQTIRQPGAFGPHVKASYSLRGEIPDSNYKWVVNRTLNEAMQLLRSGRPGPVHLNISFTEPLFSDDPTPRTEASFRRIGLLEPPHRLDAGVARTLAEEIAGHNVLIVGGFCPPSAEMNKAFAKLAALSNVVILADALANINAPGIIAQPEATLRAGTADSTGALLKSPESHPDILITFGGSLLSRDMKEWLRALDVIEHWHVGKNGWVIDSYFSLTRRVEIACTDFFPRLANALAYLARHDKPEHTRFRTLWEQARAIAADLPATDEWSARTAVDRVLDFMPKEWNLQLSNGLTPRYAMNSAAASKFHRRDCNRGVSGIDGSVSTAVGASLAYGGTTLLITGDMSMQYDLAALSSGLLSPSFKAVVINNNGGGIFRKISATRPLPETETYLSCRLHLPLKQLCDGYGISYYRADSQESLRKQLTLFRDNHRSPAILEIIVPD